MCRWRVLFHVNESESWNVALGNITNLIKDVGEGGVDVVVLANGPSVTAYADAEKVEVMKGLSGKGVKWIASVFPAACCRVKRANIKCIAPKERI